ncbi:MAG: DNA polymerase Y family protein, partial [Alphaproteobacteria bacterium]
MGPLATYSRVGSAYLITAVDDDAQDLGIAPGMTLADARALRPSLRIEEADPAADAKLLASLADFCERWTPCVALDPPDGLFLEIAGSVHLFSGETALRDQISKRITALGFGCRVAIADTPGAAWALAHYGPHLITQRGASAEALKSLPIAALRLEPEGAALLRRLGIITIGQLIERPRAPFSARIGELAQRRLDEALGRTLPAIKFHRVLPPISAMRQCLEPLIDAEQLFIVISDAAKDIAHEAQERCLSVRKLAVTLFSPARETHRLNAGYSAGERDAEALALPFLELLRSTSAAIDFEFGIEILRLDAVETVPFEANAGTDTARLVDVLSARLGEEAVLRLSCADRHIPEFAAMKTPALNSRQATSDPLPLVGRDRVG